MARHEHKTLWERVSSDFNIAMTAGNDTVTLMSLQTVTASASESKELRHLRTLVSLGTVNTTPPTVMQDFNTGLFGYFKWPDLATAPTVSTLPFQTDRRVFGVVPWVTQHDIPSRYSVRWPRLNLKPGEELFFFVFEARQSGAAADVHGAVQHIRVQTSR